MSRKPANPHSGSYKIGKGRPPLATRWKEGQSGNPKGRPRGAKNLATIFNDTLNQKYEIQEKGRFRKITAREAIVKRVVNQAMKGDIKATAFVLAKEPEMARKTRPMREITPEMDANEASKVYLSIMRGDDS